ncbi:Protein of uncharacterised function (DUF322) [Alloiococcus otitis]|uniref:Asp23/Gls24 family envelope stress response protein n=1 Tax=Alloiococcus otitis ATCC 51267 TaxID=883081 RepID=K9E8R5_9LACT|nr:Asp23/Gls24 family envelope stress response protein [Alloiococcus otitis]EKU93058.1 hypothetical protein HMPREF9698_01254 [Alloiococcus otitis ATCC 51267]SUU80810.1 Protein of uncharacterised function (DUF322) [Alloiococcus otitis]
MENIQGTRSSRQSAGAIEIAPEVLEVISHIAANEVEGVFALKGNFSADVKRLFGQSYYKNGVALTHDQDGISLDIYCNLTYGVNVPKVALEIQKRVKDQVYQMADINLAEVNVHVVSIVTENQIKKSKAGALKDD